MDYLHVHVRRWAVPGCAFDVDAECRRPTLFVAVVSVVATQAPCDDGRRGDRDRQNSPATPPPSFVRLKFLAQEGEEGDENDAGIALPHVRPLGRVYRDPGESFDEQLLVRPIIEGG